MQNKILKLIFPQWQGGIIAHWFKDLRAEDAARGYYLGAQMLDLLLDSIHAENALESSTNGAKAKAKYDTAIVPISLDYKVDKNAERIIKNGVADRGILATQHNNAMKILESKSPKRVLTLGGECASSIAPFSYLAHRYKGDVALVWIDAHPDLGLPHDDFYKGYHAMAVSALVGKGEFAPEFRLPATLDSSKVLLLGLNSNEAKHYKSRQKDFGIESIAPKVISRDSKAVLEWLERTKASKVLIHIDLDVLDKSELYVAVGDTGVMKIAELARVVNDIARDYEVVGLTIAEHVPKAEIKLRELLRELPLIGD